MACDATARLYDVDEDSVVFEKLQKTEKYDQGTVTFRARKGKLIDLDRLHESIWATRLSGGTRSGLVSLEVTAIGEVVKSTDQMLLKVADANAEFALAPHPDSEHQETFARLAGSTSDSRFRVTGVIDHYSGRWPGLLQKKPKNPRRILVTDFEVVEVP